MELSIASYVAYFRKLATQHYQILHNPQQEDTNATQHGTRRFILFETDEVVTGLRSNIGNGVVLFLEVYTFNGIDNGASDYRSAHQGRFILAEKVNHLSTHKLADTLAKCESIAWDIANKILYDCNRVQQPCNAPFQNVDLRSFAGEPVTNLWSGYSGWVMSFNFQFNRHSVIDDDRAVDPAIWVPFTPDAAPAPTAESTDYKNP